MSLARLIYVSRMTEECDMESLQRILTVSRRNNLAKGITGVLFYDPKFFLQCLEGPVEVVNELYANILRDDRHTRVTLLEYHDTDRRLFGSWAMAFLRLNDLTPEMMAQAGCSGRFDPFVLGSEEARGFLIAIVGQRQAQLDGQKDR
ncbi:MAG: BLUF domain-containing protein [Candidatus Hydrogenedentes bacterium]|nr:BLUF domain-containing protein [Candidatus Hydrogenedentota bacterium]